MQNAPISSYPSEQGIRQDDQSFVMLDGRGAYPVASWLSHALTGKRLLIWNAIKQQWVSIMRSFTLPKGQNLVTVVPASIDLGNNAAKLAILDQDGRLRWLEIPTIFAPLPRNQRTGRVRYTTYQVISDPKAREIVIGEEANGLEKARGFRVGPTKERFLDEEYLSFVKIALARLALEGGYKGSIKLALGIGIRNDEVTVDRQGQTVSPELLDALRRIKDPFEVRAVDTRGNIASITIEVDRFWPVIQTLGSFLAFFFNLLCEPAQQTYQSLACLDWGTYDLGYGWAQYVEDQPLQVQADPLARGMIRVADYIREALNREFSGLNFTSQMALRAIIEGYATVGGKKVQLGGELPYPNADQLAEATPSERSEKKRQQEANRAWRVLNVEYGDGIEQLLTDSASKMQQRGQFLLLGGGTLKSLSVAPKLEALLQSLKEPGEYFLCPEELTTVLNAIGLLVYAYWQCKIVYDRWQSTAAYQQSLSGKTLADDGMEIAVE